MTWPRLSTDRPFTVAVCTSCASTVALSALTELRSVITRCPQGLLVRTNCLLGSLTCASRPTGSGVMVVLQPCAADRSPTGRAYWLGPVEDPDDIGLLCAFLERGDWENEELPNRLCAHHDWISRASRTN